MDQALAPKKAAAQPGGGGSSCSGAGDRRGSAASQASASRGAGGGNVGGTSCKTSDEICKWVRSLPESHVPHKSRENICAIVEEQRITGRDFSDYVLTVPPEVCAPKNAMKLKAAWKNVLAESVAAEAACLSLENQPKQKATMIVV